MEMLKEHQLYVMYFQIKVACAILCNLIVENLPGNISNHILQIILLMFYMMKQHLFLVSIMKCLQKYCQTWKLQVFWKVIRSISFHKGDILETWVSEKMTEIKESNIAFLVENVTELPNDYKYNSGCKMNWFIRNIWYFDRIGCQCQHWPKQ